MAKDIVHLDAVQGDREKRNKPYERYGAVSITARQHSNASRVSSTISCADWQGDGA